MSPWPPRAAEEAVDPEEADLEAEAVDAEEGGSEVGRGCPRQKAEHPHPARGQEAQAHGRLL